MKWLRENWFKIAILLVILTCAYLVFLYETRQQNIEKQLQLNDLSASCQKLASQKRNDIAQNDSDLIVGTYEYSYSSKEQGCILAYTGSYLGTSFEGKFGGYDLFEVDNLSDGATIFHQQVNPGDLYAKTNADFQKLQDEYIGSSVQN